MNGILGLRGARRLVVRCLLGVTAALAIPTAMFAAPVTASAADPVRICEAHGSMFCLGTANLDLGTAVIERVTGRDFIRHFPGTSFTTPQGTFPIVKLEFAANTSKCVAAAADNLRSVVIHDCGGFGVDWGLGSCGGNDCYINKRLFNDAQGLLFLSGHNHDGSGYFLAPLGTHGALQEFVDRAA